MPAIIITFDRDTLSATEPVSDADCAAFARAVLDAVLEAHPDADVRVRQASGRTTIAGDLDPQQADDVRALVQSTYERGDWWPPTPRMLACPECGAKYQAETSSGIRLCPRCHGPVSAR